jgi:hypothetical protein
MYMELFSICGDSMLGFYIFRHGIIAMLVPWDARIAGLLSIHDII